MKMQDHAIIQNASKWKYHIICLIYSTFDFAYNRVDKYDEISDQSAGSGEFVSKLGDVFLKLL